MTRTILDSVMDNTWSQVRLETALTNIIDKTIKHVSISGTGVKKYHSRSDFAREACIELLKKEGIISEQQEPMSNIKIRKQIKSEATA